MKRTCPIKNIWDPSGGPSRRVNNTVCAETPLPACPHCGSEVSAGDTFCGRCGLDLRAAPAVGATVPYDDGKRRGLNNLRNSFLFLAMGAAVSLVPGISILGGLLSFIGLIFLIIGWRALGQSNLPGAPRYRSTGNWIIYSILIAIVIGVIGVVAVAVALFSSLASSGFVPTGPGSSTYPFENSAFQDYVADFYAVTVVAEIPVFYAWYRISSSLRTLGTEVGQPSLGTAGRLFLVYIAVSFASLVVSLVAFKSGAVSLSPTAMEGVGALASQYSEYVGTYAVVIILGGVAGALLTILASYIAYGGTKRASNP